MSNSRNVTFGGPNRLNGTRPRRASATGRPGIDAAWSNRAMDLRHQDEDVVVPLRLERVGGRAHGPRGRSTALVAVALVAFVGLGVGLSLLSTDHQPVRLPPLVLAETTASPDSLATPATRTSPPSTPSPVPPATPLPALEIAGDAVPTERRMVYGDGIEVLDLASGSLTRPSLPRDGWMLPIGDDQVVCACLTGTPERPDQASPSRTIRFGRFDMTGRSIVERDVVSLDGIVSIPNQSEGFALSNAISEDRRTLYLLTVARRPPMWWVDLDLIDVETGALLGARTIGRFPVDVDGVESEAPPSAAPDGTPPDGVYAWPGSLAPAPDGRTVMVSVQAVEWRDGTGTNRNREWMVPIRGDRPGSPIRLGAGAALDPQDWCPTAPQFTDPSTAVEVCAKGSQIGTTGYYVRRLAADGTSLGVVALDGINSNGGFVSMAVVRDSDAILVWDPMGHSLARVEVGDGHVATSVVGEADADPGTGRPRNGIVATPALVLSPDGLRAYAVGTGPGGGTTGVWVFDARSLELAGHIGQRATLTSIAISADGRFVYAIGAPRYDANGNDNPSWQASVTIYDASDGSEQRLHGALGFDVWLNFPSWP
jgi:hypothetical protein